MEEAAALDLWNRMEPVLPDLAILAVFLMADSARDAMSWKLACKRYRDVCGSVDMLRVKVCGDPKPAEAVLQGSARDRHTWHGLDLDFAAPMELVQQVGPAASAAPSASAALDGRSCRGALPLTLRHTHAACLTSGAGGCCTCRAA